MGVDIHAYYGTRKLKRLDKLTMFWTWGSHRPIYHFIRNYFIDKNKDENYNFSAELLELTEEKLNELETYLNSLKTEFCFDFMSQTYNHDAHRIYDANFIKECRRHLKNNSKKKKPLKIYIEADW